MNTRQKEANKMDRMIKKQVRQKAERQLFLNEDMKAEEKALLFCEFRVTFVVIRTDFNENLSEFNEPAESFCVNKHY